MLTTGVLSVISAFIRKQDRIWVIDDGWRPYLIEHRGAVFIQLLIISYSEISIDHKEHILKQTCMNTLTHLSQMDLPTIISRAFSKEVLGGILSFVFKF